MAARVYIPKWIQITVVMSSEGSVKTNVFSYLWQGVARPTAVDLNNMCANWWSQCGTQMKAFASTAVNFDRVEAIDLDSAGGAVGSFTPAQPNPGALNSDALPGNAAVTISWKSGLSGRRYRGRTYAFGLIDTGAIGSTATSTTLTAIASFAAQVLLFVNTGGTAVQYSVASRKFQIITRVTSLAIDAFIDSQRRRLIGRGA